MKSPNRGDRSDALGPIREDVEPTVLVVDDDEGIRDLFATYLGDAFTVRTASNGAEAVEAIDARVDVVLLDRRMPDMSGDEVLDRIRSRGFDGPVAMVSAVEPDMDISELPFDDYITKPVDREQLMRTLTVLLDRAAFDRQSREFFRLARQNTLPDKTVDASIGASESYWRLLETVGDLRATLERTLASVRESEVESRFDVIQDPAAIEQLLVEIRNHSLPPEIRSLLEDYRQLDVARPEFTWQWVHRLAPENSLPCVDERYRDDLAIDKTILVLFITILDDVLEQAQDRTTFERLATIPGGRSEEGAAVDPPDSRVIGVAERVWQVLLDRLERAPHFRKYEDLFRFDVTQAVRAIEYSDFVIRHPELATFEDLARFESHNMALFAYVDIDLMHSPIAVRTELDTLRRAIWHAQLMARIGNWISTWERELREGDYCSGPIVRALNDGVIDPSELPRQAPSDDTASDLIRRIKRGKIEEDLLVRWETEYRELRADADCLSTVDLEEFITGTEEILRYHIASTGLK